MNGRRIEESTGRRRSCGALQHKLRRAELCDTTLQPVQHPNLFRRQRAIEGGEVVEPANEVPGPKSDPGVRRVPGERLGDPARRALVLAVEVQASPTVLTAVHAVPGDRDVGPLALGEWRLGDLHQAPEEL